MVACGAGSRYIQGVLNPADGGRTAYDRPMPDRAAGRARPGNAGADPDDTVPPPLAGDRAPRVPPGRVHGALGPRFAGASDGTRTGGCSDGPRPYAPGPGAFPSPTNFLPCAMAGVGPFGDNPMAPTDVRPSPPNPNGLPPTPGIPIAGRPGGPVPDVPGTPVPLPTNAPPGARTEPLGPLPGPAPANPAAAPPPAPLPPGPAAPAGPGAQLPAPYIAPGVQGSVPNGAGGSSGGQSGAIGGQS